MPAGPAAPLDVVWLELFKHEYTSVKAEMSAAIAAQQTVMTYSLAASAAIFTGLLATWKDGAIRVAILAFAPIFLHLIWFIWLGELTRMARAARFLWELEKKVNSWATPATAPASDSDLAGGDLLHWEGWVRGGNRWKTNLHLGPSYVLASTALIGMAALSETLAVVFALVLDTPWAVKILPFVSVTMLLGLIITGVRVIRTNPVLQRGRGDRG